jgi:hypothetical protein
VLSGCPPFHFLLLYISTQYYIVDFQSCVIIVSLTHSRTEDIIADRRKDQAKASSGRNTKEGVGTRSSTRKKPAEKKTAMVDRSVATGRAKREAARRARRRLSTEKAPSAMEVEKEVYRQSRKTAASKKAADKKASNGRLPPNSSLRGKKSNAKKTNKDVNDTPVVLFGKMPRQNQIKAAIRGMTDAGCPMPQGYQLVMQFSPLATKEKPKRKQPDAKKQNNKNNNKNNSGNQNNSGRRGGRGQKN